MLELCVRLPQPKVLLTWTQSVNFGWNSRAVLGIITAYTRILLGNLVGVWLYVLRYIFIIEMLIFSNIRLNSGRAKQHQHQIM